MALINCKSMAALPPASKVVDGGSGGLKGGVVGFNALRGVASLMFTCTKISAITTATVKCSFALCTDTSMMATITVTTFRFRAKISTYTATPQAIEASAILSNITLPIFNRSNRLTMDSRMSLFPTIATPCITTTHECSSSGIP